MGNSTSSKTKMIDGNKWATIVIKKGRLRLLRISEIGENGFTHQIEFYDGGYFNNAHPKEIMYINSTLDYFKEFRAVTNFRIGSVKKVTNYQGEIVIDKSKVKYTNAKLVSETKYPISQIYEAIIDPPPEYTEM